MRLTRLGQISPVVRSRPGVFLFPQESCCISLSRTKQQQKGPVSLDLFIPYEYGYDFKVIVTNKTLKARRGAAYHEGRGSQEGIFAELKSHGHLNYIPVRRRPGNQTYLLAGLFAYNLMWELPMQTTSPQGIPPPSELRWGFLKKWIRFVRSSFGETVD